jgi:hypothetical protein
MAEPSTLLQGTFAALGITLGVGFVVAVHAAWRRTGASRQQATRAALVALAGTAVWMGATLALAASGVLSFDGVPPTMVLLIAVNFVVAGALGVTRVGARLAAALSLPVLVAAQSFRLPLELMMHRAATEGVMPVQTSYSGYNFDIVTGITAIVVAAAVARGLGGRRLVAAWNPLGMALLVNILAIAFLSTPLPIRVFMDEPANVWITHAPFVWLPTVMVFFAIVGHIVILRRLRLATSATDTTGRVDAQRAGRRTRSMV